MSIVFNHLNYKTCNYYCGAGYCCRMADYLPNGVEVCPCSFPLTSKFYEECPYFEPQFTINEELELYELYSKSGGS